MPCFMLYVGCVVYWRCPEFSQQCSNSFLGHSHRMKTEVMFTYDINKPHDSKLLQDVVELHLVFLLFWLRGLYILNLKKAHITVFLSNYESHRYLYVKRVACDWPALNCCQILHSLLVFLQLFSVKKKSFDKHNATGSASSSRKKKNCH